MISMLFYSCRNDDVYRISNILSINFSNFDIGYFYLGCRFIKSNPGLKWGKNENELSLVQILTPCLNNLFSTFE